MDLRHGLAVAFAGWACASATEPPAEPSRAIPPRIDFNRDVRPILADLCFKCHGFDDKARQAERRLDTREGAFADHNGVRAIVPGDLAASAMHVRIHSTDPDEAMPAAKSGKRLSERQKAILDQWIEQGAPYAKHWAFERLQQVPVPAVLQGAKVANEAAPPNPIDAFVAARLALEGLKPSIEADRYTLARRVSLDLIGLPPTPEEADGFVSDPSLDAYAKLVDRLLASPHYGERWARRWLDLARYADTNGYEKDRARSIWPWRDWVINALNADMPFDQFTIEQLAGDMLPNATAEQCVATGFHRNTMLNEEGGIDPLEFRFRAMTDRVATTGTTWLGLTVGCAQCHTHKYDPILHREYYQMMAFLDNADEPDLDLPRPDLAAQRRAHEDTIAALVAGLADKWPVEAAGGPSTASVESRRDAAREAKFAEWLVRERSRAVVWTILRPVEAKSNLPLLTVQPDGSVFASGDITKSDTYTLTFAAVPAGLTAVRLEALPDERLPRHGPGMSYYEGPKGDFFLVDFKVFADGQLVKFGRASESYAKNAMGSQPATAALAIDGDLQTGWSTSGREGEAHEAVFQLATPLAAGANELELQMMFGRHYACSLGRFRISVTTDPRGGEARKMSDDIATLLVPPEAALTAAQRDRLRTQFLLTAPELAGARAKIDTLRRSPPSPLTTLVLAERPPENPRPTFLRTRGEYLQPAERVEPGVFAFLPQLPAGTRPDRLALARWLVAPENPLTARVAVNRAWAAFFGRGLVKTTEDFGTQGDPPSHPELLDWLAVDFMKNGWSAKKLHRLVVMSATYRQSSRVTAELLARDPENRLLARGPRGRLEAEMVRDAALRAACLLSAKIGGPSVRPPQPDGATGVSYSGTKWEPSEGEDHYRRGLYTFAKRTEPYAMATTFDAPTGEACIARREVSNTPLQALTLLNDIVFIEAAQEIGQELTAQPGSIEDRIRLLFRRCLTRPPTAGETAALTTFFETQKHRFETNEIDPAQVAGSSPCACAESAAWTVLARAILNLDEAITRS